MSLPLDWVHIYVKQHGLKIIPSKFYQYLECAYIESLVQLFF